MEFDPHEGEAFRKAREMRGRRLDARLGLPKELSYGVALRVNEALETHRMHHRHGFPYSGGYEEQPADFMWRLDAVLYAKELAEAEMAAEREREGMEDAEGSEE